MQYPGLINDIAALTQLPPAEAATRILAGADAVSDEDLETLGLPSSYPLDPRGNPVAPVSDGDR